MNSELQKVSDKLQKVGFKSKLLQLVGNFLNSETN